MSKDHFKGKLDVANDIGEQLDKALTNAEYEAQQFIGGSKALKEASKKLLALHDHIEADREEGKLPSSMDLEAISYCKKKVTQAHEICLNLAEWAKSQELVANGKVVGLKAAIESAQRQAIVAKGRLESLYAEELEELKEKLEEKKAKEQEGEEAKEGAEKPVRRRKPRPKAADRRKPKGDDAKE